MCRSLWITSLVIAVCSQAMASEEELRKQVEKLEARVVQLESALKPFLQQQQAAALQRKARERMRKDLEVYSKQELQEIEQLYQVANKKWRSEEGKNSLKKLVEKYDKANRTGCALLYLGQMTEGDEQIQYLTRAINDFSDCCYGDGVQVGAYARFALAQRYAADGQNEKANELLEELKQDYPDAIDHRSRPLLAAIGKINRN